MKELCSFTRDTLREVLQAFNSANALHEYTLEIVQVLALPSGEFTIIYYARRSK